MVHAPQVVLGTDQQFNLWISSFNCAIRPFLMKMTHLTQKASSLAQCLRKLPQNPFLCQPRHPPLRVQEIPLPAASTWSLGIISNLEPVSDFIDDQQQQLYKTCCFSLNFTGEVTNHSLHPMAGLKPSTWRISRTLELWRHLRIMTVSGEN